MADGSFNASARLASDSATPVPRGIAIHAASKASISRVKRSVLAGWELVEVDGLPDWYEATPPAERAPDIGGYWDLARQIEGIRGIRDVEPLLLVAQPAPPETAEESEYAAYFGLSPFDHWGKDYDRETERKIKEHSEDHQWHLAQLKVPEAWALWTTNRRQDVPGEGVLVGHPDIGYTNNLEVFDRLASKGVSFIEGPNVDAFDDLLDVGGIVPKQPGHGTATSSVISSQAAGEIFGVAPGAMILPLRVSRSVIHFDFGNVAKAILYATENGADVISMSLGGPLKSTFVRESIRAAHAKGMIIVSAAGNQIPTTVFPAAFPEVIACAATHVEREPWRFSGLGANVDIAAPGEKVWAAGSKIENGLTVFPPYKGTGTSFATACVAGIASLWLSFHGGRGKIAEATYGGRLELVPFAFQYLLANTADTTPTFVERGRHGAGIANAHALLSRELPDRATVERFRDVIEKQSVHRFSVLTGIASGIFGVDELTRTELLEDATHDDDGAVRSGEVGQTALARQSLAAVATEEALFRQLLGSDWKPFADELAARISSDRLLSSALRHWQQGESVFPLFDRLLAVNPNARGVTASSLLSRALVDRLRERRAAEADRLRRLHPGELISTRSAAQIAESKSDEEDDDLSDGRDAERGQPPKPAFRSLRAYSFDPSLATKLNTAPIFQVEIPTRWEKLQPGPIGNYLEVVDIDPASGCVYAPVDLDHPHLLAQNGVQPSEGNPQFHQQMVYAVAMNTIHRFELALGRPIFWASLRPWLKPEEHQIVEANERRTRRGDPAARETKTYLKRDQYVRRLRIYPHALREANAYYSPAKRAVLFGYFPGSEEGGKDVFPGGMVFTCLSHDIIAHEITHALLDGMHPYFNDPTNQDVHAFHEAFADVMALFQHFTYVDVLRHQIAKTQGNLETDTLLAQLAQQLGQTTGRRGSLRDALGGRNADGVWERRRANPLVLQRATEPHERGSILVAAIFDAFLDLYNSRVADLIRIATSGTGVLPAGQLHPDLVNRLAREASETAEEVLLICIRALDYTPPIDITFGEFLRALVTADFELAATTQGGSRVAFIDAFRSWGIYPRDVQTLSEDSLRWLEPEKSDVLDELQHRLKGATAGTKTDSERAMIETVNGTLSSMVETLQSWEPGKRRKKIFEETVEAQAGLHDLLEDLQGDFPGRQIFPGLDLSKSFSVSNLRPARRIGSQGEFHVEMIVEIVQQLPKAERADPDGIPFRGGATMIVDVRDWTVRYIIYKRLYETLSSDRTPGKQAARAQREADHLERIGLRAARPVSEASKTENEWRRATNICVERRRRRVAKEPFALLHRS